MHSHHSEVNNSNDLEKYSLFCFIRCDQKTNCEDISDEKGCKIVVLDKENYLKDKPPSNAVVKIRIDLLKILEIGEVDMLFRTQYALYLEWFDSRIRFFNLHPKQGLNSLIFEEKQKIWTPSMVFDNTDEKTMTEIEKKLLLSVKREGNFSKSTIGDPDNTLIFKGDENPLEMVGVYHTSW